MRVEDDDGTQRCREAKERLGVGAVASRPVPQNIGGIVCAGRQRLTAPRAPGRVSPLGRRRRVGVSGGILLAGLADPAAGSPGGEDFVIGVQDQQDKACIEARDVQVQVEELHHVAGQVLQEHQAGAGGLCGEGVAEGESEGDV
ncbi:hypothetical protein [Longispora albida]|uniref:hypothetical protein n=1 Tax=Longispora albida TaxID=203523 RepID=UPI0012FABF74|nr:hypothetical protein [Longispora albida]